MPIFNLYPKVWQLMPCAVSGCLIGIRLRLIALAWLVWRLGHPWYFDGDDELIATPCSRWAIPALWHGG
jgi:hypothetical protein